MRRAGSWFPTAVVSTAALVFLLVSFSYLDVFPPVGEDEPWIAAAPYKLATQGTYGSDLFSGYYGVDRHNYQQMPLYPLLEAAVFRTVGIGVVQMRLLSVLFGLALLVVVFLAGRLVGGAPVGALAAALMVTQRITGGSNQIGILLLDRARINRNDIAVPVFGLLAWLLFELAERKRGPRGAYFGTGVLIGCASLSHIYGGFWLLALGAVLVLRRGLGGLRSGAAGAMVAGLATTWIPWVLFILSSWPDYVGQMRFVSGRFQLLDLNFYLGNVFSEAGPLALGWAWRVLRDLPFVRIGSWVMVLGVPAALLFIWRKRRDDSENGGLSPFHHFSRNPVSALAVIFLVQVSLFVVLIQVKTINYMIAIWPLAAILLAWLGVTLWNERGSLTRVALAVAMAAMAWEGGSRLVATARAAERMTPHDFFAAQVERCIPPGSLVLGLQHYWLGLRRFPFRTWLVPVNMAHAEYYDRPLPFDQAIEYVDPDVILIDPHMSTLFRNAKDADNANHHLWTGFERFKERHTLEPLCVIRDPTYGRWKFIVCTELPDGRLGSSPLSTFHSDRHAQLGAPAGTSHTRLSGRV